MSVSVTSWSARHTRREATDNQLLRAAICIAGPVMNFAAAVIGLTLARTTSGMLAHLWAVVGMMNLLMFAAAIPPRAESDLCRALSALHTWRTDHVTALGNSKQSHLSSEFWLNHGVSWTDEEETEPGPSRDEHQSKIKPWWKALTFPRGLCDLISILLKAIMDFLRGLGRQT
jgi:hypothetical protein